MDKDTILQDKIFYAAWIDDIAPELSFTSTNNVAESQTVTINMSDKGSGVAEYYFGLVNPEENDVTFKPCTADTANEVVTEPGKYYIACRDAAGNMSCISADYYKVSLNYGDGATCKVNYLLGLDGNEMTLPEPEKTGYTFDGWELEN